MHSSISKSLILLSLALIALSGCSHVEAIYKDGKSMLSDSMKSDASETMSPQLQAVDRANDREAARNKLAREMIAESDRSCEKQLSRIDSAVENWNISSNSPGELEEKLDSVISKRQFDNVGSAAPLFAQSSSADAGKRLANTLVTTIKDQRSRARIELDRRMEASITHYSLKQVMIDIRSYHNSCTTAFAVNQLAGKSTKKMTPEEKNAAIDELIEMRKKLMREGLNPRPVQQKIDAIITAE